jgi:DNA-binding GntR family transcriptional regulator
MAFHACLAGLTDNSYLIGALDQIGDLINLASVRSLEIDSRTHEALDEHERIVAELKAQSLSGALREMEAHIRTTEERVLTRIRNSRTPR